MTTQSDWARFFNAHAPLYMDNGFTRNTVAEVDFLFEHLQLRSGNRVLDVGCGTGRHSVELARRGVEVTGIDLSSGMLGQAKQAADSACVKCRFIECDAATYEPDRRYDAVICLCEGAFGLLGQGEDSMERDLRMFRMMAEAILPGGRMMLTTINAARLIRKFDQRGFENQFDLVTLVETGVMDAGNPDAPTQITARGRSYLPTEIALMCRMNGLTVDHLGGGTAGRWGIRPLEADEIELMLLARKPIEEQEAATGL